MHYYKVEMTSTLSEDIVTFKEYLLHEKCYTDAEFKKICSDALVEEREKCNYVLIKKLVEKYGFKKIEPTAVFSYEEKLS